MGARRFGVIRKNLRDINVLIELDTDASVITPSDSSADRSCAKMRVDHRAIRQVDVNLPHHATGREISDQTIAHELADFDQHGSENSCRSIIRSSVPGG